MTVYLPNIPLASDLLSVSQGNIKDNFFTANAIMDVNHYPFNDTTANKGKHKFVAMPVLGAIPTVVAGDGAVYTKTNATSQLFFTADGSGNEYQLTTTSDADFSKFGTSIAYGSPPAPDIQEGGWTFLPGGLLLQYGKYTVVSGNNRVVQFPIAFTSVFCVQVTAITTTSNQVAVLTSNDDTTFTWRNAITSAIVTQLYWSAIGKK